MQPGRLDHIGTERGQQVPLAQRLMRVFAVGQQVADVVQQRRRDQLVCRTGLFGEGGGLQPVFELCHRFVVVLGPAPRGIQLG